LLFKVVCQWLYFSCTTLIVSWWPHNPLDLWDTTFDSHLVSTCFLSRCVYSLLNSLFVSFSLSCFVLLFVTAGSLFVTFFCLFFVQNYNQFMVYLGICDSDYSGHSLHGWISCCNCT
jgi:hypothetical protein